MKSATQSSARCKNHRQETLGLHSEKQKRKQKEREAALTGKNAVGKVQQKPQYAIYRGTAPRYTKRSATLSLKRHTAWEYTETTTHHKCLSLSLRPRSPRGPMSAKSNLGFEKTNYFLTCPFLLRQNRQVKKEGIVGTPPHTWYTSPDDA